MFNQITPSFTDMTKRLSAINIMPQLRDSVTTFKEENVKEINRILTALSEVAPLPASVADVKLDYALLHDEARFFDAFKTIHLIAVLLTDPKTMAIIRDRLITRYPFDMKNRVFVCLNFVATVPESHLDLLCFYFERDYEHEFGEGKRNAFTRLPTPRHENTPG